MTWKRALLAAAIAAIAVIAAMVCLTGCGPEDRSARGLYRSYCQRCHGRDGEGRGSARRLQRYPHLNLTTSPLIRRGDRDAVRQQIAEGEDPMPGFSRRLTPEEIESLVDLTLQLRNRERGD